ncbi:MAG TPA: RNA polymerase sigma factor [Candidatus Binataceae bacterium]|nr:RNA polymerase sigma factor [Candidatus Binataceae bacterium]
MGSTCLKHEDPVAIVVRAQSGDDAALEELGVLYQQRIGGFVYSLIGDPDAIADTCHSVFLKMITGLKRLREPASFEPWLFRIARNACNDFLRRKRMRQIFVAFERKHEQVAAPARPERDSRIDAMRRAIAGLPARQRELISLLQDNEWSYEDLARITRTTVGSVKSRLFRAREYLRERITAEELREIRSEPPRAVVTHISREDSNDY